MYGLQKIGNYKLGKTLGSGARKTCVRLATHADSAEEFAVRIFPKDELSERQEDYYRNEVERASKLSPHPNVMHTHDHLESTKEFGRVVDLVKGGELFELLAAAKQFDEGTARNYFRQILDGLNHLHVNGFPDGGLKPERLLLSEDSSCGGVVKILACCFDGGLGPKDMMRPVQTVPYYTAPEILQGGTCDRAVADLWTCGVFLYAMLAGRLPFDDQQTVRVFVKIEKGEYKMSSKFSPMAADLIQRLLTVDPKKRSKMDAILQHPWMSATASPLSRILIEKECVPPHLLPADLLDHCCCFMQPTDLMEVGWQSEGNVDEEEV